jgi:hypothetical protein
MAYIGPNPITVPDGGTDSQSFNINGMVISGSTTTSALTALTLTNGQIVVGSTGASPVATTITGGTGITVSNGSGTITISSTSGGIAWNTTAVNITNMTADNGYFCVAPGGALTLGLPATSVLGDTVRVSLSGAASFQITQGIGQQIQLGANTSTFGNTGSLTSNAQGDSVELVCVNPSQTWVVQSSQGNLTLA